MRTTAAENIALTRVLLAAVNRRDKAAWLALCHPEMENVPSRDWPETEPIRGAAAVWDFMMGVIEIWDRVDFEWGELMEAGPDKVVANQRAEPRGKKSGAGVVWGFWVILTFQKGKVLRFEWFAERTEALEAAGISE